MSQKTITCGQQTDDVYFDFQPFLTRQFILLPKSKKTTMARRMSYSTILIETLSSVKDLSDTCHLHENVTKSDIISYDHSGWLTDSSSGKPVWCVITDMILCCFENDSMEKSSKVLILPAFTIKSLVFNSAARNDFSSDNVKNRAKDSSKTVSGMERYQIVIENDITGDRTVFGTNTRANLDRWVAVLKVASSLDLDILNQDSENEDEIPEIPEMASQEETINSLDILSKYTPSSTQDSKRKDITLSWLNGQANGNHVQQNGDRSPAVVHKIGNLSSLSNTLPNKKWCSTRKSLSPIQPEVVPIVRRAGKSTGALDQVNNRVPPRPMSAMYSYELPQKMDGAQLPSRTSPRGIGSKIVRRASLIKEIFKSKPPKSPTEQIEPTILSKLHDVKISGYLNQKTLLSWSKHWCIVSKGIFYSFKHKTSTETPDTTLALHKYTLSLPKADRNKRENSFKLSRTGGKTISLAALDTFDFNSWIKILRGETQKSADDSTLSTPELSHLSAVERRSSSSNSNSVHEFTTENRRDSVQSRESSNSGAPVLDYPESSDDDRSSVGSSLQNSGNFKSDTPPKHDVALRQLWSEKYKSNSVPRRAPMTSLGFDVSDPKEGTVLFLPDEIPESSESDLDDHDVVSADDVFNDVAVPDIKVTHHACAVTYPSATSKACSLSHPSATNELVAKLRKLSISRSCGDLPALCDDEKQEDSNVRRLNQLNLDIGSGTTQNNSTDLSASEKAAHSIRQDVIQMKRQKLLQDMMKQREEIEKRQINKEVKAPVFPKSAEIANKYQRAQIEEQQKLVRDATYLRQRRTSTQLKVDTLERKINTQDLANNNRKSMFGFGGKQKSTLKNEDHKHLQEHLSELKGKLTDIDKGLEEHEKHRQQTMKHLQTSESQAIQRLEQHEKLKASLGAIMEVVESPKPPRKFHLDNASIASSTPDGSPGLLKKSANSKRESTCSNDLHRRSSSESNGSTSKSSKGSDSGDKINPNTIAQIEEFELLAQQVLMQKQVW